jgi:hypothetical protein
MEPNKQVKQKSSVASQSYQPINIKKMPLQNVSDSRLLELANQYITTDESLEKFQQRLKEKYKFMNRDDYMMVVDNTFREKNKINKNFGELINNAAKEKSIINPDNNNLKKVSQTTKPKQGGKGNKNITSDLGYYDMLEY